jgi:hypothetical protein
VDRRLFRSALVACLVSIGLLSARFAAGAPNDAAAQKLRDQAIDQDYLGTNYPAAEKKLTDALALCQRTSDCSPFIRARLHCDLGVVEYALHKLDLARTEFATALLEDPNVDLDKDLANTDVQREFSAAKSGGAPPAGPPSPGPAAASAPAGPGGTPPAGAASGGMIHVAPRRQQVHTPLPLYVEVAPDFGAARVIVRFKPVGGHDWKTIQLSKRGNGFGGEIPCADVAGREGELQYFVQALDANGDLVAASGRSVTPHSVAIVRKLEGEAPHLPGEAPPEACKPGTAPTEAASGGTDVTEASDCPPGLPGCHAEAPTSCESKDDCMVGEECVDHGCRKGGEGGQDEGRAPRKNWLSLVVQADILLMPGANNACAGGSGYSCFRSDNGNYYADIPVAGFDDQVLSGLATAPMIRILLGYDRVVWPNFAVGARLGYAIVGGGPQRPAANGNDAGPSFFPVQIEGRIAYWLGKNVFARKGLRFFGFASAGLTEVDASQSIDVRTNAAGPTIFVDAWRKTGVGFASVGPGMMYAVTPNGGLTLEVKPIVLFPTFGFALSAALGYSIGL